MFLWTPYIKNNRKSNNQNLPSYENEKILLILVLHKTLKISDKKK